MSKTQEVIWPYLPQPGPQDDFWMKGSPNEKAVRYIGYGGARGGGKDIINSCQIKTRDGSYLTHGTAKVGDLIANPFGGEQAITEIHPQGRVPVVRIKFEGMPDADVVCSRGHLWNGLILEDARLGSKYWVAEAIETRDVISILAQGKRFCVPVDGMQRWAMIESIQPDGEKETTCITVENNHGLYVLENGGVVTHNSFGLRSFIITALSQNVLQACIVRQTLEDLKKNHIQPMNAELKGFMARKLFKYNQQDRRLEFPNGSSLQFMYCKTDQDLNRFQGLAFDILGIEEAGQLTQFQISYMISSNRSSPVAIAAGTKWPVKCMMTFNWGGSGHHYLRRIFVDKKYDPETETPSDYIFIPAKLKDNAALMESDPEYAKRLQLLPEKLRRAYIDGDPDAFTGTMFNIADTVHIPDGDFVLETHGGLIPENWGLFGALDPGAASPCSFGLYAKTPEGQIYKILNYYESNRSVEDHAIKIKEAILNCRFIRPGRLPDYISAGADAFARQQRFAIRAHDVTWQDVFRDHGLTLVRAPVGAGSRRSSCMALQNMLDFKFDFVNDTVVKAPRLQFFRGQCTPTLDELKALERSASDPEDIQEGNGILDHAYDETRYAIMAAVTPFAYTHDYQDPPNPNVDYGREVDERRTELEIEMMQDDDGGWETYFG